MACTTEVSASVEPVAEESCRHLRLGVEKWQRNGDSSGTPQVAAMVKEPSVSRADSSFQLDL